MILFSIGIVLIYPSYPLVTAPQLRERLLKKRPLAGAEGSEQRFAMGKWGHPGTSLLCCGAVP